MDQSVLHKKKYFKILQWTVCDTVIQGQKGEGRRMGDGRGRRREREKVREHRKGCDRRKERGNKEEIIIQKELAC